MDVNSLKSDIELIHNEVRKVFSEGSSGNLVFIGKMEKVLDRCLYAQGELGDEEINKIFQWICWSIRTEKTYIISPVVRAAYRVTFQYIKQFDLTREKNINGNQTGGVLNFAELQLELAVSKVLTGEPVSLQMLDECIKYGRLDILRFLRYSGFNIDVRDENKNSLLIQQAVIHGQARVLEFLISEGFPIHINKIKLDSHIEIHQYDLLLEDSFYHAESCEIAEILFPALLRANHTYPVYVGKEKQFNQTHFLIFTASYISPQKFAWYLEHFMLAQEKIDFFSLCANILGQASQNLERSKEMLKVIKRAAEKENKFDFIAFTTNTFQKYYMGTFPKEIIICLKEFCDPKDPMWVEAIHKICLNLKNGEFIKDFPFEVWGYQASIGNELLEIYQKVEIPGIFAPDQSHHYHQKFKIRCFKEGIKCKQPLLSSLEYWKIGKELLNYNLIAHLGHKKGKRVHTFEKITYVENYEGFPSSRYMYKIFKKAYLELCKNEISLFDKEIDMFLDLAQKNHHEDLLSLIQSGQPYSVSSGYKEEPTGHAIELLFFGPYLVICDLGNNGGHNFKIYHINKDKLTQKILDDLALQQTKPMKDMFILLDGIVQELQGVLHPLSSYLSEKNTFIRKNQIVGNCEWASKEASWMFFNWLLQFKSFASEEEWSSGVLEDEKLKEFFTFQNMEKVSRIFHPSLSHALLRFLGKQLKIIEERKNIVTPDWRLFLELLISPLYISVGSHDSHYVSLLAKLLRLAPSKEICLLIDELGVYMKEKPLFFKRLLKAFYQGIEEEVKLGMKKEEIKQKYDVLLERILFCTPSVDPVELII